MSASPQSGSKTGVLAGGGVALLLLVGLGVWLVWPSPPEEPEVLPDGDTGMSIEAQERLAFEIGYLKQEAPPAEEGSD
ncbi:MAG: hypothetical protein VX899_27730 [Myxococcota bacterium]|nr:hypothetical protein [Myxococcota bacterium]